MARDLTFYGPLCYSLAIWIGSGLGLWDGRVRNCLASLAIFSHRPPAVLIVVGGGESRVLTTFAAEGKEKIAQTGICDAGIRNARPEAGRNNFSNLIGGRAQIVNGVTHFAKRMQ